MSMPNPIVLLDARARYAHPAFQMSRASTKTVFDSSGRLATVPANALGWGHDPATGQALGYLSEPEATNLFLHSNDLTQGAWVNNSTTITPNATTGPDGSGMAKLVEDTSQSGHFLRQDISISNEAMAFQLIVKEAGRATVLLRMIQPTDAGNQVNCRVHLTDGTLTGPNNSGTGVALGAGASYIADGFYRVWVAGSLGPGISDYRCQAFLYNDGLTYEGDGTSGVYIGNMQAEEGPHATSYIETGGSTATRSRDVLQIPDMSIFPWWRADRGTIYADCLVPEISGSGHVFGLVGGFRVAARGTGTGALRLDGSLSGGTASIPYRESGAYRLAVSWEGDKWVGASNGAIFGSGEYTNPISEDTSFGIGCLPGFVNTPGLGHSTRCVYYPAPVSSADLQSLTAIQE